jgi:O-antigen ligase
MLVERPQGFGPLRYRLIFDLEPHNSYIGAFANDGWIGGFAWLALVLTSCFVGLRLMIRRSPVQRLAQVFAPSLFVLLMQGFQIDIDHWRQVFLCFGAVWGMEAARMRWVARTAPTGAASSPQEEAIECAHG